MPTLVDQFMAAVSLNDTSLIRKLLLQWPNVYTGLIPASLLFVERGMFAMWHICFHQLLAIREFASNQRIFSFYVRLCIQRAVMHNNICVLDFLLLDAATELDHLFVTAMQYHSIAVVQYLAPHVGDKLTMCPRWMLETLVIQGHVEELLWFATIQNQRFLSAVVSAVLLLWQKSKKPAWMLHVYVHELGQPLHHLALGLAAYAEIGELLNGLHSQQLYTTLQQVAKLLRHRIWRFVPWSVTATQYFVEHYKGNMDLDMLARVFAEQKRNTELAVLASCYKGMVVNIGNIQDKEQLVYLNNTYSVTYLVPFTWNIVRTATQNVDMLEFVESFCDTGVRWTMTDLLLAINMQLTHVVEFLVQRSQRFVNECQSHEPCEQAILTNNVFLVRLLCKAGYAVSRDMSKHCRSVLMILELQNLCQATSTDFPYSEDLYMHAIECNNSLLLDKLLQNHKVYDMCKLCLYAVNVRNYACADLLYTYVTRTTISSYLKHMLKQLVMHDDPEMIRWVLRQRLFRTENIKETIMYHALALNKPMVANFMMAQLRRLSMTLVCQILQQNQVELLEVGLMREWIVPQEIPVSVLLHLVTNHKFDLIERLHTYGAPSWVHMLYHAVNQRKCVSLIETLVHRVLPLENSMHVPVPPISSYFTEIKNTLVARSLQAQADMQLSAIVEWLAVYEAEFL